MNCAIPLEFVVAVFVLALAPVIVNVMVAPTTGEPIPLSSFAWSVWVVPATFGPEIAGVSVNVACWMFNVMFAA